MAHLSDGRPPNRRPPYEHGGEPEEIRRSTVILSLAGTSSGKPARSYAAIPLERIALLTLGAAASDAMLWRALVSTTKRTLKPATARQSRFKRVPQRRRASADASAMLGVRIRS